MIKAIIFDFDGTIANSEPIHFELFARIMKEEEVEISSEENDRYYLHLSDRDSFELALRRHERTSSPEIIADLVRRKSVYYKETISRRDLLFPEAADFIRKSAERYPVAIASGALTDEIEFILRRAGLFELFPVIVGAERAEKGKPDPECYLKALDELNRHWKMNPEIHPSEVMVIEDSVGGIEGAHRAGMVCLAVTNSYSRERLIQADLVVDSLDQIDPGAIRARVRQSFPSI